jgi:hypothetical protein
VDKEGQPPMYCRERNACILICYLLLSKAAKKYGRWDLSVLLVSNSESVGICSNGRFITAIYYVGKVSFSEVYLIYKAFEMDMIPYLAFGFIMPIYFITF